MVDFPWLCVIPMVVCDLDFGGHSVGYSVNFFQERYVGLSLGNSPILFFFGITVT